MVWNDIEDYVKDTDFIANHEARNVQKIADQWTSAARKDYFDKVNAFHQSRKQHMDAGFAVGAPLLQKYLDEGSMDDFWQCWWMICSGRKNL